MGWRARAVKRWTWKSFSGDSPEYGFAPEAVPSAQRMAISKAISLRQALADTSRPSYPDTPRVSLNLALSRADGLDKRVYACIVGIAVSVNLQVFQGFFPVAEAQVGHAYGVRSVRDAGGIGFFQIR